MSLVDQSGTVGHFGPENSREIQSVPGLNQSVCSCVREWPTWFPSGTVERSGEDGDGTLSLPLKPQLCQG